MDAKLASKSSNTTECTKEIAHVGLGEERVKENGRLVRAVLLEIAVNTYMILRKTIVQCFSLYLCVAPRTIIPSLMAVQYR